jgi:hypothetical protein
MCLNLGKASPEELEELYKTTWILLHARWRDLGKEISRVLVGIRMRRWRLGTVSMNYAFEIIKPKRIEGRNIYFLVEDATIIDLMIAIIVFDRRLDVIPQHLQ